MVCLCASVVGGVTTGYSTTERQRESKQMISKNARHKAKRSRYSIGVGGRAEAIAGAMGAGDGVEAGSGKFWWRAEMFWRWDGAAYRQERFVSTHLHREKGATAVH